MRTLGIAPLALALAAACATPGAVEPGPPPFQGVRTLALVRRIHEPAAARRKDPLDALAESLAARGYAVRVVEVGAGRGGEHRGLERLHDRLGAGTAGGPSRGRSGRRVEPLGREAAEAVAAAGVDAVAMYHRFDPATLPALPEPPAYPGDFFPSARPPPRPPLGALSLVDRGGNAVSFEWGAPDAEADPAAAVNAAEAIELLLGFLAGEPEGL